MNSLEEAKKIINETDEKMAELFCKRMRAYEIVCEYKKEHGLTVSDRKSEEEIISKNSCLVNDKILREYYTRFLAENMALANSYQERLMNGMKVAYSGTEGAFAHIASGKLFFTAQRIACPDFSSAYKMVEKGEADAAVLPLENSYNGEVGQVTDLIFSGPLCVNNVVEIAVTQDLLVVPGTKISDIKEVVSHPQALGQCANYIKEKGFASREYSNTALAAKYIAEKGEKSMAAIASAEAAEIFGLTVLERNINSSRNNTTKFAVLTRAANTYPSGEKGVHTLLMFTVRNEAGALAKAINIIGNHGFNMIALRSRNMKELLWQYYFYVELEGDIASIEGTNMLEDLKSCCDKLKIAGTFKKEMP